MELRYALIGCGRISSNHIAAALECGLTLVALCDILEERVEEKKSMFSLEKQVKKYIDYKEMLEREQIDVIAITTESGKHAAIALDCLEAGCHLIIEKPIALSLEDADEILKKAKKLNRKVSTCHQNRFNKSIQKIKKAMDENRFGKVFHGVANIRWNRNESYYAQALWRGTWELDGGALMNQCIHNIDLLCWMMGEEIEELVAYTDKLNHPYIEGEDLGLALIKFTNGSYGMIEGTTNLYPKDLEETLYIFGEKGTVKAGGKSVNLIEEWNFIDGRDKKEEVSLECFENPPNVYGFGHIPLYKDVIQAIKDDREPYINGVAGRNALEVVLAIYKSSKEGSIVKFPLINGSTLDYKGRFER